MPDQSQNERRSLEHQYVERLMASLPDRREWTLKQAFLNLFRKAALDQLTGVYNRNGLDEGLRLIDQGMKKGEIKNVGAIYLDIDDFKKNQDDPKNGHAWGDLALQHLAYALDDSVRKSDLVVRMGGDEFCLILPAIDNENLHLIISRLFDNLQKNPVGNFTLHVTWGVSVTKNFEDLKTLISRASKDMEKEKSARHRGR